MNAFLGRRIADPFLKLDFAPSADHSCDIDLLDQLDRRIVRKVFQERFTADVMARNYLRLYWRLCGAAGRGHAPFRRIRTL